MFESSMAVPLIIKWPGVVKPGSKVDALVSNVDMFPSVLSMLGVDLPKNDPKKNEYYSVHNTHLSVTDFNLSIKSRKLAVVANQKNQKSLKFCE